MSDTTYTMKKVSLADLWKADKYMQVAAMGLLIPDDLAKEAFPTKKPNEAELFLYLFRRFGAPIDGVDIFKTAAAYTLTTPMDGVYLRISIRTPNTWGCCWGYAVRSDVADAIMSEYRSEHTPTTCKANAALTAAIRDLESPTYTRDVYFNMFGSVRDDELHYDEEADWSTYKGLPVAEYYGAEEVKL